MWSPLLAAASAFFLFTSPVLSITLSISFPLRFCSPLIHLFHLLLIMHMVCVLLLYDSVVVVVEVYFCAKTDPSTFSLNCSPSRNELTFNFCLYSIRLLVVVALFSFTLFFFYGFPFHFLFFFFHFLYSVVCNFYLDFIDFLVLHISLFPSPSPSIIELFVQTAVHLFTL